MDSLVPRRPANHGDEFVNKLNEGYRLELRVPSRQLPPIKRMEIAEKTPDGPCDLRIDNLIHQLSYRSPDILERIDSEFNQEAKEICSNWVHKHRAVTDLLPGTDILPKASNATERKKLRDCLLKILVNYDASCGKDPRIQNQPTRATPCSKRLEDEKPRESDGGPAEFHGSPNKKARSRMDGVSCYTTFPSPNANRSFVVKSNLTATHPPPNHSFGGISAMAPRARDPGPAAPGGRFVNQDSANTSMTTRPSEIFSAYDSGSSQSTVPNDDREEYKDIDIYRPQTPIRPAGIESTAHLHADASSGFTWPLLTSSEEQAMIALDPTAIEVDNTGIPIEVSEDAELPDVPLTGPGQNAESASAETTMAIRQRNPFSSAPPTSITENSHLSADFDDTLSIHGGVAISDEAPICHQGLTLEDQLRDSWRK